MRFGKFSICWEKKLTSGNKKSRRTYQRDQELFFFNVVKIFRVKVSAKICISLCSSSVHAQQRFT